MLSRGLGLTCQGRTFHFFSKVNLAAGLNNISLHIWIVLLKPVFTFPNVLAFNTEIISHQLSMIYL